MDEIISDGLKDFFIKTNIIEPLTKQELEKTFRMIQAGKPDRLIRRKCLVPLEIIQLLRKSMR